MQTQQGQWPDAAGTDMPGANAPTPKKAPCAKQGKPTISVFHSVPSMRPYGQWIGEQPIPQKSDELTPLDAPRGFPQSTLAYKDKKNSYLGSKVGPNTFNKSDTFDFVTCGRRKSAARPLGKILVA